MKDHKWADDDEDEDGLMVIGDDGDDDDDETDAEPKLHILQSSVIATLIDYNDTEAAHDQQEADS